MLSDQHLLSVNPVSVVSLSMLLVSVTNSFFMAHGHQSYTQTSNLEGLSLSGIFPLPSGVALPEAQDSMLSW